MRRGSGCWQSLQANSCAYLVRACGTEELQLCEVSLRSYVGLGNHNVSVSPDGRDCSEGKRWVSSDSYTRWEVFFPFVNVFVASFSAIPWNVHEMRGLFFFSNCSWLLIAVWPVRAFIKLVYFSKALAMGCWSSRLSVMVSVVECKKRYTVYIIIPYYSTYFVKYSFKADLVTI